MVLVLKILSGALVVMWLINFVRSLIKYKNDKRIKGIEVVVTGIAVLATMFMSLMIWHTSF